MPRRDPASKILAILGTILIWIPLLIPIFFGIQHLLATGKARFDYLMPAELFPFTLAGALLLIWAAWRARLLRRLVGWSFGAALILLTISLLGAQLTGLASGRNEPEGWRMLLVFGAYFAFLLALVVTAVGGILLVVRLFRKETPPEAA
jgi:hypothetical protein